MHNRTSIDPELDIVADILAFLVRSIDIALAAGVERRRILIRSGLWFRQDQGAEPRGGSPLAPNSPCSAVRFCSRVSRKSTFGAVTGQKIPAERMVASVAAGIVGVVNGAAVLRVHDVAAHVEAMQVLNAIAAGPPASSGS